MNALLNDTEQWNHSDIASFFWKMKCDTKHLLIACFCIAEELKMCEQEMRMI